MSQKVQTSIRLDPKLDALVSKVAEDSHKKRSETIEMIVTVFLETFDLL